jgi:hypothetical protein
MQKPAIAQLNAEEQVTLLKKIEANELNENERIIISDLILFTAQLKEKLKNLEITINNLKRLFGCSGEALKKLLQMP